LITFADPHNKHPTRVLTLHLDNGRLKGTFDAPVCPCVVSGKMKSDKLKLQITPHGAMSITYEATVTDDTMKGESYFELAPTHPGVKFRGIRQVRADAPPIPAKN
jgi:hypothetical protein